jgi:hypothetical protein
MPAPGQAQPVSYSPLLPESGQGDGSLQQGMAECRQEHDEQRRHAQNAQAHQEAYKASPGPGPSPGPYPDPYPNPLRPAEPEPGPYPEPEPEPDDDWDKTAR